MIETHLTGIIAGVIQFAVAIYALRLNRRYGTDRVGWSLFGAFSLLALLQLVQCTTAFNARMDAALKINVIYALISFLLLIGMVHLETMLKERLRIENMERDMRAELESEVKKKTAHLTRALEELMKEMEETKRMSAIIESHETEMITRKARARTIHVDFSDSGKNDFEPALGEELLGHS
jgi:esterase/lipase